MVYMRSGPGNIIYTARKRGFMKRERFPCDSFNVCLHQPHNNSFCVLDGHFKWRSLRFKSELRLEFVDSYQVHRTDAANRQ